MNVSILFEDEYIVAVSKPNNMLVHPSYYARNIKSPTLIDVLANQLQLKLYPVHRLDYKTSGILLLAKSTKIAAALQEQFETHTITKTYLALVRGYVAENGVIDSPVKNPDTGKYKAAETHFNRLEQTEVDIPVQPYPKSRYSLLCFLPKTGRMHQLRKHANKISHPIIGDHRYGNRHHNRMFETQLELPNLFLHAYSLKFKHPVSEQPMEIKAELPEFWGTAFERLKMNAKTGVEKLLEK